MKGRLGACAFPTQTATRHRSREISWGSFNERAENKNPQRHIEFPAAGGFLHPGESYDQSACEHERAEANQDTDYAILVHAE